MLLIFSALSGLAMFRRRVTYSRHGDLGREATACLVLSLEKEVTSQLMGK